MSKFSKRIEDISETEKVRVNNIIFNHISDHNNEHVQMDRYTNVLFYYGY